MKIEPMTDNPTAQSPPPFSDKAFEPATGRSPARAMDHRSYVTLDVDYMVESVKKSNRGLNHQFTRFALRIDPHLYIPQPIAGLPIDWGFNLLSQFESNLDGSQQRVSAGLEVNWGLAPIAQIYLANSAVFNLAGDKGAYWRIEGGLNFPTLLFDGRAIMGLRFGWGGTILGDRAQPYFSIGGNLSF